MTRKDTFRECPRCYAEKRSVAFSACPECHGAGKVPSDKVFCDKCNSWLAPGYEKPGWHMCVPSKPTEATFADSVCDDIAEFLSHYDHDEADAVDSAEALDLVRDCKTLLIEKDAEIERLREIIKTERNWLVKRDEALEKARAALENAIR